MGAFDEVAPITIPDPSDEQAAKAFRRKWHWDSHEMVMIKGTVTVADQEYVTNKFGVASQERRGDLEYRMGNGRFAVLDRMIVDWTLLSPTGMKMPITPATIRRLPANYANPILEVIDSLTQTMTEAEQDDFFAGAIAPIEADSVSMKQLLKQ